MTEWSLTGWLDEWISELEEIRNEFEGFAYTVAYYGGTVGAPKESGQLARASFDNGWIVAPYLRQDRKPVKVKWLAISGPGQFQYWRDTWVEAVDIAVAGGVA